ncbi:hypothetical protein M5J20_09005 [Corynebacterium sp. TA-R-1]|uniref:ApeA N-terminal domain-containing protein n=1 Tax=Corynebacterium stercoris TaxID=2943490 RepID=A0ABT1G6M1_9CORY|nr:hypothetical protein [Corynebacterium stercoris]
MSIWIRRDEVAERNCLRDGQRRQGWVLANNHAPISAVLLRDKGVVSLSLASQYEEPGNRWPKGISRFRTNNLDLIFVDDLGKVELVNCLSRRTEGGGPYKQVEKWVLEPQLLVFGGNGNTWSTVQRVETVVPALQSWLGEEARLVNHELIDQKDATHGDCWLNIQLRSPKMLVATGTIEHTLQLEGKTETGIEGGITAFSAARIITNLDRPESIHQALAEHSALLDFLSIVYGVPIGFSERIIQGTGNPIRDFNGRVFNSKILKSCPVLNSRQPDWTIRVSSDPRRFPLIEYEQPEVFTRWLTFWAENRAGIAALSRAISEQASWENRLLNAAVAFEEFGYKIEGKQAQGTIKNSFPNFVKRVCLDMPRIALSHPEKWADQFNQVYKGVKHADKLVPDLVETANAADQAIGYLRAWCCFKADPDNPIIDARWGRILNPRYAPPPRFNFDEPTWQELLTEQDLHAEGERMDKLRRFDPPSLQNGESMEEDHL